MHKRFLEHLKKESLLSEKETLILGISGGPDSVCLLVLLEKIKKALDLKIILVHINYNLRKESRLDEELVKKYAKKYQEKLFVFTPKMKKKDEATLRNVRYRYFRKVKESEKGAVIVTAHNLDDNIETMLLFFLRGSGLTGLSGIKQKQKDLVRPLLFASKKETIAYLNKHKLPFRIDRTNKKNIYTRNKIRNLLIPYLEKNFNPNIRKTLQKTNQHLSNDAEYITKEAKKALTSLTLEKTRRSLTLDAKKWNPLHPSIKSHLLRAAILEMRGNLTDLSIVTFLEIVDFINSTDQRKKKSFAKRLQVSADHDKIRLSF